MTESNKFALMTREYESQSREELYKIILKLKRKCSTKGRSNVRLEEHNNELSKRISDLQRELKENTLTWHYIEDGDLPREKYFGDDTGEPIYCKIEYTDEAPWNSSESEYYCDTRTTYDIIPNHLVMDDGRIQDTKDSYVIAWCELPAAPEKNTAIMDKI